MIREEKLFSNNIINIFTDASITKVRDTSYGCSGAILVLKNNIIDTSLEVISNTTNNYCELYAIILGISLAIKYSKVLNPDYINLFSDSKISIESLRSWIFKWLENPKIVNDSYIFVNSIGKDVANQELIIQIIKMIVNYNIRINFYHQNGHITNTEKSRLKAANTFYNNGIVNTVEDGVIQRISVYNNFIDNLTRNHLLNNIKYSIERSCIIELYNPCNIDMDLYKKLINV